MRNDFLDYDGLYLAHSSGPWKKHKYVKKINGVYYYGTKTELGQVKNKTDKAAENKAKQNELATKFDKATKAKNNATAKLVEAKQEHTNPINVFTKSKEAIAKSNSDQANRTYEQIKKDYNERVRSNYDDDKFVSDRTLKKQVNDKVNDVKSNIKTVIDREKNGMTKKEFDSEYDDLQKKAKEKSNKAVDELGEHLFDDDHDAVMDYIKKRDEAYAEQDKLRDNRYSEEQKSVSKTKTAEAAVKNKIDNAKDAIRNMPDNAKNAAKKVDDALFDISYETEYQAKKAGKAIKNAANETKDTVKSAYDYLKKKVKK